MSTISDPFHDEGDEVIDEIRSVRRSISQEHQNDPYKLVAYYMAMERDDPASRYIPAPDPEASGKSAA